MELPPNEAERLAALVRYGLLDTEFEEPFDRMTRILANVFNAPIALVTLIDGHRQWFKSAHGLPLRETPREHAFCHYVILEEDVVVVPDATQDTRFSNNPLVHGEPRIRFYAGAPLVTGDGYALGTACFIDRKPRPPLTERERRILTDIAAEVIDEIEFRQLKRKLGLFHRELGRQLAAMGSALRSLQAEKLSEAQHKAAGSILASVNTIQEGAQAALG
jgi:GAF domain-containing protein